MNADKLITMNGKIILDSNVIIDFLRGNNDYINNLIEKETVFISVIVLGELIFGAENSPNLKKHLAKVDAFLEKATVVYIDETTARIYGKIRADLRKEGKPIPENDIWIAAIALQHNFILATNDNHFKKVNLLKIIEI
jgi:tRNA(fMet)-specific endonuclease VapC